jgi:hypothetical protein
MSNRNSTRVNYSKVEQAQHDQRLRSAQYKKEIEAKKAKQVVDPQEAALIAFDRDARFGPLSGITRLLRLHRAMKLNIQDVPVYLIALLKSRPQLNKVHKSY